MDWKVLIPVYSDFRNAHRINLVRFMTNGVSLRTKAHEMLSSETIDKFKEKTLKKINNA